MQNFRVIKTDQKSKARRGILTTTHGKIQTPFFMPIATAGAVKTITPEEVKECGAQIILSNTYHLMLRPGMPVIRKAGGLHKFMNWPGPILTDSGGYQVFSLSKIRKIKDNGVEFQSHLDGSKHLLTPEKAIKIQETLNSDIMMVLDECPRYPTSRDYAKESMNLTTKWALRCKIYHQRSKIGDQRSKNLLFGIVQGSVYKDLRIKHAKELAKICFDGYAIGGLAVGEPIEKMYQVLDWVVPELPEDKPRYLMGVGKPEQVVEAVKRGVDMFDCVIPTRNARHGLLYKFSAKGGWASGPKRQKAKGKVAIKKAKFYEEIRIQKSQFRLDMKPVDPFCECELCQNYSRAYLRHLFMSNEPLALRLATLHNISFYLRLMELIRENI
ncbi:MAG: tRNA guanosine(34) transglycosylase Tgt [Candidatus Kerfeldbacteria bacterium CG_4_10_14_0_8_um_filter_42_10]|uniref:Queuine tRNA-ribosyltransferase n=1 Tax=Candidatus Kerfeldbacteria bacterium CG_4_10_14_0_8_um_filter_42_10 TaxID=2014248 RepID=A0A2M7RKN8_9BACT|nr:MAG: tRNA guanosine(34) transglycosylase Tgt [Candidatus Kerfeldbacteria bacterium CG_4_10_14_0_8_um_filter_42_10]